MNLARVCSARDGHFLKKRKPSRGNATEMSRLQRSLPWARVTKEYSFDGPNGRETLADLFAGRSQLIVSPAFRLLPSTGIR